MSHHSTSPLSHALILPAFVIVYCLVVAVLILEGYLPQNPSPSNNTPSSSLPNLLAQPLISVQSLSSPSNASQSSISPAYLTTLSHSNALALAQSQIAASTSNILNSVIDRIPTYHLMITYHIAPAHTLPDPSVVSYLAHNDPITTKELHRHISRLSELLASGVLDSATLTLTPNNP